MTEVNVTKVDELTNIIDHIIIRYDNFYTKKSILDLLSRNNFKLSDSKMIDKSLKKLKSKGMISFNKETKFWTRINSSPDLKEPDVLPITDQEKLLIDSIHKTAGKIAKTAVDAVIQTQISDMVLAHTKSLVFEEFRTEIKPALRQHITDKVVSEVTEQIKTVVDPLRNRIKALETKFDLISTSFLKAVKESGLR